MPPLVAFSITSLSSSLSLFIAFASGVPRSREASHRNGTRGLSDSLFSRRLDNPHVHYITWVLLLACCCCEFFFCLSIDPNEAGKDIQVKNAIVIITGAQPRYDTIINIARSSRRKRKGIEKGNGPSNSPAWATHLLAQSDRTSCLSQRLGYPAPCIPRIILVNSCLHLGPKRFRKVFPQTGFCLAFDLYHNCQQHRSTRHQPKERVAHLGSDRTSNMHEWASKVQLYDDPPMYSLFCQHAQLTERKQKGCSRASGED